MNSDASEQSFRVAVIGAGITGLAAAHRLVSRQADFPTTKLRVTVLEAADRTGGIIQTVERDGFLVELGPDSFITNKPGAIGLCREIGFEDQLIATDEKWRRSLVLSRGRPLPVPDGFMLMAPSNPWAILTTPILSVRGRIRLLGEAFIGPRSGNEDESLASFVRRRFGSETLDRLVQPLVGGIYTSDPEKLSLEATLPRFPEMEREHGSVIRGTLRQKRSRPAASSDSSGSGARYGLFLTARDGLSSMVNAVAEACLQTGLVQIETGCRVESIQQAAPSSLSGSAFTSASVTASTAEHGSAAEDRRHTPAWRVQIRGEAESRHFDAVVLTLPTPAAAGVLQGEQLQALCTALRAIEYASSAIVVSGHHMADFRHPLDAFGLVIPDNEHRDILAVSFSSRKFPGRAPEGCVLLRTFVGGAMQPHLLHQSDEEIVKLVDRELTDILGMKQPAIFSQVVRYTNAMPQYHVGHLQRVRTIEQACAEHDGLQLAGSAYHGVGIPDSIASGRDAADRVLCRLASVNSANRQ